MFNSKKKLRAVLEVLDVVNLENKLLKARLTRLIDKQAPVKKTTTKKVAK